MSEPKVKTIWVCPQCNWVRPKAYSSHKCGKCGSTLVPKIVKEDCEPVDPDELQHKDECNTAWVQAWKKYIKGYTEEYKNKNWRNEELYLAAVSLHNKGLGRRRIAKVLGVPEKAGLIGTWLYKGHKPRPAPDLAPSPELAYVIGATLGDGTLSKEGRNYRIRLMVKDKDFAEEYKKCLQKVSKRSVQLFYNTMWIVNVNCKELFIWLKQGLKALELIIDKYPAEFVRGFADAEGSAVFRRNHKTVIIYIYNGDYELLRFIQKVLKDKLHIDASGPYVASKYLVLGQTRKCWRLTIGRHTERVKFAGRVGFTIKRKRERLKISTDYVSPKIDIDLSKIIVGYTQEYQDKHWKKCRFSRSLRNCGEWVLENGEYLYTVGYHSKNVNGKFVIFCKADDAPCDAKWLGEKECSG